MSDIGKLCAETIERLHPFLDGELTGDELAGLKTHLSTCPECAEIFDSYKHILDACHELDADISPPLDFRASWRHAVREAARGRKYRSWVRAGAALAAALAIWVGSTAILRSGGRLPSSEYDASLSIAGMNVTAPKAMSADQAAPMDFAEYEVEYDDAEAALQDSGLGVAARSLSGYAINDDVAADVTETSPNLQNIPDYEETMPEDSVYQGIVILRSASLDMETTDFDGVTAALADLIGQYNGFEELSEVSGRPFDIDNTRNGRSAQISARIPQGDLDAFIADAGALGEVTYSQSRAQDISSQYADVAQRLRTATAQRDRLRELLAQAEDMTDIITIEDKLTALQSDIEWMQGTVREWDGLRDMARVELSLREVREKTSILPLRKPLGERISEGFYSSLNALRNFAADMLIALVWALPQLVIWVPMLALIVLLSRIIYKKARKGRKG